MRENDDTKHDDELMAAAARLPQSVAPERDLWPGIAEAIATPAMPRGAGWNRIFAQAAAVLLLVGASSGLTWFVATGSEDPMTVPDVSNLVFEPVSGNFGSQYHLGPDFDSARNDLAATLERQLAALSPETRAEVEKNMATIRQAIADINVALDEEPNNALLQQLLMSAYQKELSLMIKVDGMTKSVMRRTDI